MFNGLLKENTISGILRYTRYEVRPHKKYPYKKMAISYITTEQVYFVC